MIDDGNSGPPEIVPAQTSVAAFVGPAEVGPLDEAVACASFAEFIREFGELSAPTPLSYAVQLFFANGGTQAVVVRVGPDGAGGPLPNLIGDGHTGTGIYALAAAEFNLLNLAPAEPTIPVGLLAEAARFCHERRAVLVAEPPVDAEDSGAVAEFAAALGDSAGEARSNTVLYFPRLRLAGRRSAAATVAAGGPVAGVIARTDAASGVWKAPTGTSATLEAVTAPALEVDDHQVAELSALGVNSLRSVPGTGTVVWGAHTLAVAGGPASEWSYVPVRRTALHIETSLCRGLEWAVFEPADERLWSQVARAAAGFLDLLWRQGAFQGTTPEQAFFVRCDRTTMTQDDVDSGRLVVLVGFAPLRPAEFVIIRIGLFSCAGE